MLSLIALFHGDSGVGKSWLGTTAPGPRLVLDVEGRALYAGQVNSDGSPRTTHAKVYWDPRNPPPPAAELTDDTSVIVTTRDFQTFKLAYQWLASGQHPFRSVVIDSLTELQQRCMDSITGGSLHKRETDDWGSLLLEMDNIIRQLRDLRTHPTNPIQALVILALSHEKNYKQRPMLQGQLSGKLAGYFDLVGYMTADLGPDGKATRKALIQPIGAFEAKDNTHTLTQTYGTHIPSPDVGHMLYFLNNPPVPA